MEASSYSSGTLWHLSVLAIILNLVAAGGELTRQQVRNETVCYSKDIRNHVDFLDELQDCTVIEGHLQIVLIEHAQSSDYDTKTFPKLREITDYLLLYRVYGLKTLSHMFPNLNVIRGQKLFYNYALVVFEVPDIEELGLAGLTAVVRGAIRLEKNQNLCYETTIDWSKIINLNAVKMEDNFIVENKDVSICVEFCPRNCPSVRRSHTDESDQYFCWTSEKCQKICDRPCSDHEGCYNAIEQGRMVSRCCHRECLGGCYGPGNDQCFACKHIFHEGICQPKCPEGTYMFLERRCITEEECRDVDIDNIKWKILEKVENGRLHRTCEENCPTGFTKAKEDDHKCVECEGSCPKVCVGLVIDNVAAAQKLRGCTVIQGILEIQIRGGTQVELALEEYLGDIEVVTGFIRILQSSALSSLSFFKKLKAIEGNNLHMDSYALFVLDNGNLQDIWSFDTHPPLRIANGKVFFHFNRKLCLDKIEQFVKNVGLKNVTETKDVSDINNGDLIACNITDITIRILKAKKNFAMVGWTNFHAQDSRELLSWVINYREAPAKNITMFDARDACGTDVWKTEDVRPDDDRTSRQMATIVYNLKPYTQYAVYVQTYMISSANRGAMSPIIYFTTEADIPTSPQDITVKMPQQGELHVSWTPPSRPNGNVTHYYVRWQPQKLAVEKFDLRDYCVDKLRRGPEKDEKDDVKAEEEEEQRKNKTVGQCSEQECCECPLTNTEIRVNEQERLVQIEFENFLQNTLYRPKEETIPGLQGNSHSSGPIAPGGFSKRRKRSPAMYYTPPAMPLLRSPVNDSRLLNDTSFNVTNINVTEEEHEEVPFKFVVVYNTLEVYLPQLSHYQEYSIEVIACHDYQPGKEEKLCSQRAITSARTLPLAQADVINEHNITVTNETYANNHSHYIQVRWAEPLQPNGLIVSYGIEWRALRTDATPTPYCLSHKRYRDTGGYKFTNLHDGAWAFRLRSVSLAGPSEWTGWLEFHVPSRKTENNATTWIIVGTVCGCVFIIVCTALIMSCLYIQRKSNNIPDQPLYTSVNPDYVGITEVYLPDEWEVDRDKIEVVKDIGQGSFGMVYEGIAQDIAQEHMEEEFHGRIRVAIKTVMESSSVRDRVEFLNEASVMKSFRSYHVLRLLGVVSKTQPTYVIMEYMANGDLKTFMRMHRPDYEEGNMRKPPTLSAILQMAGEIADGMAYLTAKKFVHRDLAARNCMVSENFVVKIGDFGMTRDIYDTDYYRKSGKGCLPVRWMAPESLRDGTYTSLSDVWSYGVVLWEMATLAAQPYQGLTNEEVLKYVLNQNLMEIPDKCPEKLHELMIHCWQFYERNRPSFCDIIEFLKPDLNSSFPERSFYFSAENRSIATELDIEYDEDDAETAFQSEDEAYSPLTCSPLRQTYAMDSLRRAADGSLNLSEAELHSTHSSLSYDSRRNRFRNSPSTSPSNNQNSYLLGEGDAAVRRPYPPLVPRTVLEPHSSDSAAHVKRPNSVTQSSHDPLVLKETAHLWQRPSSPARDHSSANDHPGAGKDTCHSTNDHCNNVDNSRDSSKSSGGSGGRNGFKNGHIAHLVPSAQC